MKEAVGAVLAGAGGRRRGGARHGALPGAGAARAQGEVLGGAVGEQRVGDRVGGGGEAPVAQVDVAGPAVPEAVLVGAVADAGPRGPPGLDVGLDGGVADDVVDDGVVARHEPALARERDPAAVAVEDVVGHVGPVGTRIQVHAVVGVVVDHVVGDARAVGVVDVDAVVVAGRRQHPAAIDPVGVDDHVVGDPVPDVGADVQADRRVLVGDVVVAQDDAVALDVRADARPRGAAVEHQVLDHDIVGRVGHPGLAQQGGLGAAGGAGQRDAAAVDRDAAEGGAGLQAADLPGREAVGELLGGPQGGRLAAGGRVAAARGGVLGAGGRGGGRRGGRQGHQGEGGQGDAGHPGRHRAADGTGTDHEGLPPRGMRDRRRRGTRPDAWARAPARARSRGTAEGAKGTLGTSPGLSSGPR